MVYYEHSAGIYVSLGVFENSGCRLWPTSQMPDTGDERESADETEDVKAKAPSLQLELISMEAILREEIRREIKTFTKFARKQGSNL